MYVLYDIAWSSGPSVAGERSVEDSAKAPAQGQHLEGLGAVPQDLVCVRSGRCLFLCLQRLDHMSTGSKTEQWDWISITSCSHVLVSTGLEVLVGPGDRICPSGNRLKAVSEQPYGRFGFFMLVDGPVNKGVKQYCPLGCLLFFTLRQ